jgi:hypothetical protein
MRGQAEKDSGQFEICDGRFYPVQCYSPPGDGIHRSVLLVGEQDSRGEEIFPSLAVRNHVIKARLFNLPAKYGALCRPTNIGPLPVADNRLEIDSIKLTISNQDDFRPFRYQSLHFPHQFDMDRLGQVPLLLSHDRPGYGEKLLAIDNPYVESDTTAPHCSSINRKNQRFLRKGREKSTGYGQNKGCKSFL